LEHRREFVFELSDDDTKARLLAKPLAAQTLVGRTIRLGWGKDNPVIRQSTVGKGQVIQLAVDMGTLYRYTQSPLAVQAVAALMTDFPPPDHGDRRRDAAVDRQHGHVRVGNATNACVVSCFYYNNLREIPG
jgi:hypothetical protein